MSMVKDISKLQQFVAVTEQYIEASASMLGEVSEQSLSQSFLPPLRVLKFYAVKLNDMLNRNDPKRAPIGEDGGMYTVPDNVVSIQSGKKRAGRWNEAGTVRLIEVE